MPSQEFDLGSATFEILPDVQVRYKRPLRNVILALRIEAFGRSLNLGENHLEIRLVKVTHKTHAPV